MVRVSCGCMMEKSTTISSTSFNDATQPLRLRDSVSFYGPWLCLASEGLMCWLGPQRRFAGVLGNREQWNRK